MTSGIFILLGSNLGDKSQNLNSAKKKIEIQIGQILKESSVYETAAWGKQNQPAFLNQVVQLKTLLAPHKLLDELLSIEDAMGRKRIEKWGERLIDLDILYYNDQVIEDENLKIPHPGIPVRRFTLTPLVEIAPDFQHPLSKKTNQQLLEVCTDDLNVLLR
ncbi:MAG: 2-amino-4-hydroxy-6-hydroxymethyldihydropteridine diphosphokinase [Bacteroidota bacterium]